MHVAVLFAGIGGWEIACGMHGIETRWAAEWDDWKRERYHEQWPDVPLYADVAGLDGAELVRRHGPLDILLGSPPCTDISSANVRGQGIDGDSSRYYLHAIRIARETGARWIGFENSPRLRSRGADRVCALLGDAGYTVWPCVVAAEDAGAPHIRARSFLVGCRHDVIAGAHDPDAASLGAVRQQAAARRHAPAGPKHAWPAAEADGQGQPHGAEHAEVGGSTGVDGANGAGGGAAADVHRLAGWRGTRRQYGEKADNGPKTTPCHSGRARLAEWQGVGENPDAELAAAQRAALSPWDQRGDGLVGHLSVAHGLADRLRGHGLSDRAVKAELARWRSALGDALVIPVVWAVVRAIVRTDAELASIN